MTQKKVKTLFSFFIIVLIFIGVWAVYLGDYRLTEGNPPQEDVYSLEELKNRFIDLAAKVTKDIEVPAEKTTVEDKIKAIKEEVEKEAQKIIVLIPEKFVAISSPFIVTGKALLGSDNLFFRLSDDNGNVLLSTSIEVLKSEEAGLYVPFSEKFSFTGNSTSTGVLEVYEISSDFNTEINAVSIPLYFQD